MTLEQAALLKKAKDSLDASRLLVERAFYDFAVSRAYYSMFYIAEAFLLGEGLSFSKHSAVIAAFGQHFVKTGRVSQEFHRYLIEGEDSRNVGDYDTVSGLGKEEALEQIHHAARFLELADKLLSQTRPE
ncbi:MAG: HEPN domain-containing protein [Nitrospirota bacterium]